MSAAALFGQRRSLRRRIDEVEQRLQQRRHAVRNRVHAIGGALRSALTSPLALLLVAGAGFLTGRRPSRPRPAPRAPEPGTGPRRSKLRVVLVAIAIQAVRMAGVLGRHLLAQPTAVATNAPARTK